MRSSTAVAGVLPSRWSQRTAQERRHPVSGRVLAPTMGVEGAAWLDRPEREKEEAPSKAIAALGLKKGDVVADIGAGSGYYTVRLAEAVGPTGRVVATDLQPGMLAIIKARVAREKIEQRRARPGTRRRSRPAREDLRPAADGRRLPRAGRAAGVRPQAEGRR